MSFYVVNVIFHSETSYCIVVAIYVTSPFTCVS